MMWQTFCCRPTYLQSPGISIIDWAGGSNPAAAICYIHMWERVQSASKERSEIFSLYTWNKQVLLGQCLIL